MSATTTALRCSACGVEGAPFYRALAGGVASTRGDGTVATPPVYCQLCWDRLTAHGFTGYATSTAPASGLVSARLADVSAALNDGQGEAQIYWTWDAAMAAIRELRADRDRWKHEAAKAVRTHPLDEVET
jgi:hypothetical protein